MAAVAGLAIQFIAQRKEARAQRKISREQQRAAALEAHRARRRTIREARIARGTALNIAGQVGAGESSGLAGGLSGISAQAGANLGFSGQTEAIGRRITGFGAQASRAASLSAIGGGVASLGGALFSNRQVISGFLSPPATPG